MQQQISVVTLGIASVAASKKLYSEGFGWTPVFQNEEVVFYQMNGLMLGTWLRPKLEGDIQQKTQTPGAFAHNVGSRGDVETLIAILFKSGGRLLTKADAPLHGGHRGCVADPDDHTWEVAFNPAWKIDAEGM